MASIFKRSADKKNRKKPWLIQYFDHEGKKRTKTGFPDIELTRQLASKIEHEAKLRKAGLAKVDEPVKAEQPVEDFLASFRQHIARSDNTEKHVRQTCTRVSSVIHAAEIKTPKDIEFDEVESALRELKEDRELSNKTYNDYLQAFDQFCRWLSDGRRAILLRNPVAGMQRLNSKVDVQRPRRAYTAEEVGKLVDAALKSGKSIQCYTGLERAQIYLIAYFTGLRRAEIASLTPASFDLTAKRPTFRVEAGASKNGNRASLPIHSFLAECLQRWLDDVPRDQVLFPKLAKRKTSVMVERDLERAGIPYRNSDGVADFHALRHTYISNLVNLGGNVAHARSLARHADIRTTIGYTHFGTEEQTQALKSLPSPTGISQQFLQQWIGRDSPSLSSNGHDVATEHTDTEAEPSENDLECQAIAVGDAGSPESDFGFDPRRLHFASH